MEHEIYMGEKEPERKESTKGALRSEMGTSFPITAWRTFQLTLPVGGRLWFEYILVPWASFSFLCY